MRIFLTVIQLLVLLAIAISLYDPTWVSSQVPEATISAWAGMPHREVLLGAVLVLVGFHVLHLAIFLFTARDPGMVSVDGTARPAKVKNMLPKTEWLTAITSLNTRDRGDGKPDHAPVFSVKRSRRTRSIIVLLSDVAYEYHDEHRIQTLGSWTLQREEVWIDEARCLLMHRYITAMRLSGRAKEEGQRVVDAQRQASAAAAAAAGAAPGTPYLNSVPKA